MARDLCREATYFQRATWKLTSPRETGAARAAEKKQLGKSRPTSPEIASRNAQSGPVSSWLARTRSAVDVLATLMQGRRQDWVVESAFVAGGGAARDSSELPNIKDTAALDILRTDGADHAP